MGVVYGSELMTTGLDLLRTMARDGNGKMKEDYRGVSAEMWIAFFVQKGFAPASALRVITDLVKEGYAEKRYAEKSDDKKTYYITKKGFAAGGKLKQPRPPKKDHRQPKLSDWIGV